VIIGPKELTEYATLLAQAAEKIIELRRRNEVLEAKVEVMDFMREMLFAQGRSRVMGYEEDIVPLMQKTYESILHEIHKPMPDKMGD